MARPAYTQDEADALLAMHKVAPFEAQFYAVDDIRFPSLRPREIELEPSPAFEGVKFVLRTLSALRFGAFSMSLWVSWPGRPTQYLCRYDVHRTPHPNNDKCGGIARIPPGQFHVHRYRESMVAAGYDWDACADVLDVGDGPLSGRARRMQGLFVEQMRVELKDHSKYDDLFRMSDR